MEDPKVLSVKVLSPTQILYDGPASSVSANNRLGPFDILPEHANFFSLLTRGNILVNTDVKVFTFPAQHGIIKVSSNKVVLFIYLPE